MSAKASSLSSTVSISSATTASALPVATTVGICVGSLRSRESTSSEPIPKHQNVGTQVADPGAEERAAPVAGEAGVVGRERRPGDDVGDHEVDALAERDAARAAWSPERVQVRLVEHPPGQVDDRGGDRPGGELLQVAADEADRADQPEHQRDRAEERAPRASARGSRRRARESAAAAVEMMISSKVDQPRFCATFSTVGAYEPRRPSGARSSTIPGTRASAPIAPARPSSTLPATAPITIASERLLEREHRHEPGGRDDHEQADGEVAPEQRQVEEPEHAQALRHGRDSPARCVCAPSAPFAGASQIRFDGCDLSRLPRHPGTGTVPADGRRAAQACSAHAVERRAEGDGRVAAARSDQAGEAQAPPPREARAHHAPRDDPARAPAARAAAGRRYRRGDADRVARRLALEPLVRADPADRLLLRRRRRRRARGARRNRHRPLVPVQRRLRLGRERATADRGQHLVLLRPARRVPVRPRHRARLPAARTA